MIQEVILDLDKILHRRMPNELEVHDPSGYAASNTPTTFERGR